MAFLDKVKPIKVQVTGSRMSPEEKCRAKMVTLLRRQSKPKKGRRSWFLNVGDQEVFVPRYANVNLVQRITGGNRNAYPVYKTRQMTLRMFTRDVQEGRLDRVMLDIAGERSKQLTGKRRKKRAPQRGAKSAA
jgi:hypothetical protein